MVGSVAALPVHLSPDQLQRFAAAVEVASSVAAVSVVSSSAERFSAAAADCTRGHDFGTQAATNVEQVILFAHSRALAGRHNPNPAVRNTWIE